MKIFDSLPRFGGLLALALFGAGAGMPSAKLHAAEPDIATANSAISEELFASPHAALQILQAATQSKNQAALNKIFGPMFMELSTGDPVQDAINAQRFATRMAQGCSLTNEGSGTIILLIGTNNWPFPIPLVRAGGQWYFDTAAGKEEILNRHIGKDEYSAIGVCRAYVTAQQQYAQLNLAAGGVAHYAQKFKSSPGKKDGLYWPVQENEAPSPFGPLVAEAHAEGYGLHRHAIPHAFHGYYFKILTRQGEAAPGGKKNYLSHGSLIGGFALLAYPADWGQSGIMTFIVNQDGKVYQRDFGGQTARIAPTLVEYNPDNSWTLVSDEGILSAASEK